MSGKVLLLLTVVVLSGWGVHAGAGEKEKPPKGVGKYIMILRQPGATTLDRKKPMPPKKPVEPDVTKRGGRVLERGEGRVVLFLPLKEARRLRADENVAILQHVWTGESEADWEEPADASAEVQREVESAAKTDLTWSSGTFEYDPSGNISKIGTDTYAYDAVNRVTSAVVNGTGETFHYDSFGNLTEKTRAGSAANVIAVDPGSNRLLGEVYDAAGNVLTSSRSKPNAYVYDSAGMITEYHESAYQPHRMIYTAEDERVGVWSGYSEQHWMIRDFEGRVLREFSGSTLRLWVQDYVYAGGQLVGGETEAEDGGRRHFHTDQLGSVRMTTMEDRMRLGRHDYMPFGNEQTSTALESLNFGVRPEPMKYTGHERDYAGYTNIDNADYLDYMHARYYNPALGRFLSVDPSMDLKKTMANPQAWNRYSYVTNNPLRYVDPDGREMQFSDYVSGVLEGLGDTADKIAYGIAYPGLRIMRGFITDSPKDVAVGTAMIGADALMGAAGQIGASKLTMGFVSRGNLLTHFEKHGAEMGFKMVEAYGAAGQRFASTAGRDGIQSIVTKTGEKYVYNASTKEFAMLNRHGEIVTYYKASSRYWSSQLKKLGEEIVEKVGVR